MTDRFPLLRLPQDALRSVLQSMEPLDLILLSFFSNRVKSLVASINLNSEVTAVVSDYFIINVDVAEHQFQFEFYCHEVKNGVIPMKLGNPGIVYLHHFINDQSKVYVVPKVMDIPSWFNHIKVIFNCPKILYLHFYEDVGNFELDSIRYSIIQENIDKLAISTQNSEEYNRKIMKTFSNIKHLSLETEVYENGKPPGEVLIQNFCKFDIGCHSGNPTTIKLDDVLMMNSKCVVIAFSEITEKDANRFLKLWMRGNSKSEYFFLRFSNGIDVDRNTVLKGIKFQEVPLEVNRLFYCRQDPIEGGIDVVRRDGTRGTIFLGDGLMRFFVWHDYCRVEK